MQYGRDRKEKTVQTATYILRWFCHSWSINAYRDILYLFFFAGDIRKNIRRMDYSFYKSKTIRYRRRAQAIAMFTGRFFGRQGMMILFILLTIQFSYLLIKEIKEFRRYKRKCRLYHEGTIENFYDIYDDEYEPLFSWRKIKALFSKKDKANKKKYPSKRKMKRQWKEIEKKWKK